MFPRPCVAKAVPHEPCLHACVSSASILLCSFPATLQGRRMRIVSFHHSLHRMLIQVGASNQNGHSGFLRLTYSGVAAGRGLLVQLFRHIKVVTVLVITLFCQVFSGSGLHGETPHAGKQKRRRKHKDAEIVSALKSGGRSPQHLPSHLGANAMFGTRPCGEDGKRAASRPRRRNVALGLLFRTEVVLQHGTSGQMATETQARSSWPADFMAVL